MLARLRRGVVGLRDRVLAWWRSERRERDRVAVKRAWDRARRRPGSSAGPGGRGGAAGATVDPPRAPRPHPTDPTDPTTPSPG